MENNFNHENEYINNVGFFADRILFVLKKRVSTILKEKNWDISQPEMTVLETLNVLGKVSQSKIANTLGRERAGISKSIILLEEKGYVKRSQANGSTNAVELTKKGYEKIPEINSIITSLTNEAFKGFSSRNQKSLMNYLSKIYQNLLREEGE